MVSKIIGAQIISAKDSSRLGQVHDLLFDPASGKLLAIFVSSRKNKIVVPGDILNVTTKEILINEEDSILDIGDVIRVKDLIKSGIKFRFNNVYTENNEYLGRAVDLEFQIPGLYLSAIEVSKRMFFILSGPKRIIKKEDIILVKRTRIIVKNPLKLQKVEAGDLLSIPAA